MEGSLILANGEKFTGKWHGATNDCFGEIVPFTGMGRFQEFVTDPANQGKIVLATFPGILNSELDSDRFESDQIQIAGLIIQQANLMNNSLLEAFTGQEVPILFSADTRALMKRVKNTGELPAVMTVNSSADQLTLEKDNKVSMKQTIKVCDGKKHIVIINFGYKKSLLKPLVQAGFKVTIVSNEVNEQVISELKPDGIIFSGGPGNPSEYQSHFGHYKEIAKVYPTIGVGLGHQILALSFGATVEKMLTGHRSFREPVIHAESNKVYMSAQNHGFTVKESKLSETGMNVTFKNIQDGTVEGLIHNKYKIATFQFHPEGKNSPLDEVIFQPFFQQVNKREGVRLYA